MSCPSREELDALLAPGVPRDPARATAVLAHTRECEQCRELLRADSPTDARAVLPRGRARYRPNLTILALAVVGLALGTFSRACRQLSHPTIAPITTSSR